MLATKDATTIDADAIRRAERLIRPHIRRTPMMTVDAADFGLAARPLLLKLELFQHAGSFKPRGAFTNLLTRPVPAAGVVAASGGNHGAAVAYAAKTLGHKATIFVPSIASPAKLDRIRCFGAELVIAGDRYVEALAASEERAAKTGALQVHAYDQPETLIGQGTLGLELEEQASDLDTLLVAVGGGGLIGGVAVLVSRPREDRRRRAGDGADALHGACKPASRSMRRPAASPPTRSRRSRSGS